MKKKSFTLVEIMIVVAIIAILAAIAVPALGKNRDAAMAQTKVANVKMVNAAVVSYLGANYDKGITDVGVAEVCSQLTDPATGAAPKNLDYLKVGGDAISFTKATGTMTNPIVKY